VPAYPADRILPVRHQGEVLGALSVSKRPGEALTPTEDRQMLPARNHTIVLVSKVHLPTLRALAYARATRPDTLTALTVATSAEDARRLQQQWADRDIPVPLTVLESPYIAFVIGVATMLIATLIQLYFFRRRGWI